jgi:hypothetical protein
MTLFKGPLSYQEDNWFSFSLNFILAQFKFIPAEFKYTDTQRSKNPFSYTDKDRRKKRYVFYVSGKSPNLPISIPLNCIDVMYICIKTLLT